MTGKRRADVSKISG